MLRRPPETDTVLKPADPKTEALRVALAGGTGALALAGFAAMGEVGPGPAVLACILLSTLTAGLALGALQSRTPAPDLGPPPEEALPFEDVLRALPEPVLLVGAPGPAGLRLTFVNRAARDLFPGAEIGSALTAAIRSPGALEIVDAAVNGQAGEIDVETRGAQDRVWRLAAEPLRRDGAAQAVVMLRDETDVRRVARMRADFLANASHELRTPLASLTGFIETLQGPAKDDQAARERFLGIMGEQAGRMGRLINDLLSLSRIEMNEHIAPEGEADLGSVVRDVLDAMAPAAAQAPRAQILTELPPHGAAVVRGDRDQLVQVAQNLIDNALKYAGPAGEVRVVVSAGLTAERAAALSNPAAARLSLLSPDHASGERYTVLRVSDSGPGIPRENLPRLSERFYRVEGQKSGKKLGTGLGLAIVKHIINRHKGGLVVESAVGQGATFTAYLPSAVNGAG